MGDVNAEWIANTLYAIERLTRDLETALLEENRVRRGGQEQISKLRDYIRQVEGRTAEQVGQAAREIHSIEAKIEEHQKLVQDFNADIHKLKDNIYGYIDDAQQEVVNDVRKGSPPILRNGRQHPG
jgi:chromosome segregation ATPase